jgi:hypothetical protein
MLEDSASTFDRLDPAVVEDVEALFRAVNGDGWSRLGPDELTDYPTRQFTGGWRLSVKFLDGVVRRIDVLITPLFPIVAPRTALVDHPPKLTWPHVEDDGILCLLGNSHQIDIKNPVKVVENLLARSCRLIEELLEGTIVERDFKDEFLTYWAYDLRKPERHYSLLDVRGPSRPIRVWYGRSFTLLAEDDETLKKWLGNRFKSVLKPTIQTGVLLWLNQAPLPSEYPHRGADLLELAKKAGASGIGVLESIFLNVPSSVTVILGAEGRDGPGLMAVTVDRPADANRARRRVDPILKGGFRPEKMSAALLAGRYLGASEPKRSRVARADPDWIHGRARDPRTTKLRNSKAVLFGCGSLGSFVAASLIRAGVGTLDIVDFDELDWPNVGRHYLGATSVGRNKATELAEQLSANFPHATITGHDANAEQIIFESPIWFSQADLIVSTTGSGRADTMLNEWHRNSGRSTPIVYGWTEPYAGAGHAVAIAPEGGCLFSGVDSLGMSLFEMTEWARPATFEESACGVHFAPYGPTELGHVNDLIAELALDCLLNRVRRSAHRIWAARREHLEEFDGKWTEAAQLLLGVDHNGGKAISRPWPACRCCELANREEAA